MIRFIDGIEAERLSVWVNTKKYYTSRATWVPFSVTENIFTNKNGSIFDHILINLKSKTWEMDACHEIAHVLDCKYQTSSPFTPDYKRIRDEVRAWRLAKSFCKKKYWDEKWAIFCVKCHTRGGGIKVNWDKFRIIEMNEGIKL